MKMFVDKNKRDKKEKKFKQVHKSASRSPVACLHSFIFSFIQKKISPGRSWVEEREISGKRFSLAKRQSGI
jgi:hypothetical protein